MLFLQKKIHRSIAISTLRQSILDMIYPANASLGGAASYKRLNYSRSMSAILERQEYGCGDNSTVDHGPSAQPMFKVTTRTRTRSHASSDPLNVGGDFCINMKRRSSTLVLGIGLFIVWSLCMSNMLLRLQYSSSRRGIWLRTSSSDHHHHHQKPLGPLSVASPLIRTVSHSIPLPLPKVGSRASSIGASLF